MFYNSFKSPYFFSLIAALLIICSSCSSHKKNALSKKEPPEWNHQIYKIKNLSQCSSLSDTTLYLNPDLPTTLIVHGCSHIDGRFYAISNEFEKKKQQTICFNYNDRNGLDKTADDFALALKELDQILKNKRITLVSHSQGSLISRRALTQNRSHHLESTSLNIRFVSISGPFGGIQAASHCSYNLLHIFSLGTSAGICWLVTGNKWSEIHKASAFINEPGILIQNVFSHIKINTNEKDTCRKYDTSGKCLKSDYVFSLPEQNQNLVDNEVVTKNITVHAGHVEIIGDHDKAPEKLLEILKRENILATNDRPNDYNFNKDKIIAQNPEFI